MKKLQIIALFMVFSVIGVLQMNAQNHKYYVRALSQDFNPDLYNDGNSLRYNGKDTMLKQLFDTNIIYVFEKAFKFALSPELERVFYVETDNPDKEKEFATTGAGLFDRIEYLGTAEVELLDTYPNDYGTTSPSPISGLPVRLEYMDYIKAPLAWDYETGNSDIKIGISDGYLIVEDAEFVDKTETCDEHTNPNAAPAHGTGVSQIIAAQGDNGYGVTGVCYDCDIIKTRHTSYYDGIMLLSTLGAKVINCSWRVINQPYNQTQQDIINLVSERGSIVVAASGNESYDYNNEWSEWYPASYDNVISVAGVGYLKSIDEVDCSDVRYDALGNPYLAAIKGFIGATVGFQNGVVDCSLPLADQINSHVWLVSTSTLNDKVDITAPSSQMFRYGAYLNQECLLPQCYQGDGGYATSPAAPQVSGSIGLMLSQNECLTFNEVESILKITSVNIDDIPQNSFHLGKWGSGSLQTGDAVKLTNDLMVPSETAYLENQKFERWDFLFNGISKNIVIRNQNFTEESTLTVNGKNAITIEAGTLIEPNQNGFAILQIDPGLVLNNNCPMLTEPCPIPLTSDDEVKNASFMINPTVVETKSNISKIALTGDKISSILVYNMLGALVYSQENLNTYQVEIELLGLSSGVYVVKAFSKDNKELFNKKIIKK